MNRPAFSEINAASQVGISILVILASFLTFVLLSFFLTTVIFGVDYHQLITPESITNPAYINAFKFLQIAQSIGLFVIPPLILGRIFSVNSFQFLQINYRPNLKMILLAFCIAAFAIPLINLLAMLNTQIRFPAFMSTLENYFKDTEKSADTLTMAFMNVTTISGLMINLLMMAVIPAIGEEFFFRGYLQKMIAGWTKNNHWAIIITGFIFSAIHMQFYGFFPRWLLGMLLGYMFLWSGNLWLPIVAHFTNNALAVVGYYLVNIHVITEKSTDLGSGADWHSLFITMISTSIMAWAIYTYYANKKVSLTTD